MQDQEYAERSVQLLSSCSKRVLEVLSLYLQAPGKWRAMHLRRFLLTTLGGIYHRRHPHYPEPSICLS